MSDYQRVYITTVKGYPSFLVHRLVRDKFIAEKVRDLCGTQDEGREHEWVACDEEKGQEQGA